MEVQILSTFWNGRRTMANCLCYCGKEFTTRKDSLKSGHTKSCGCYYNELFQKDYMGKVFGRLTVTGQKRGSQDNILWECRCSCGNIVYLSSTAVHKGDCGCVHREKPMPWTTHGMTRTKDYTLWRSIIERCYYPNNKGYHRYGGRGIGIAPEWRHDFMPFYEYVSKLEHYLEKGFEIDRINNDGNYEPGNLRFVTKEENMANRRNTTKVTFQGEEMTLVNFRLRYCPHMNHSTVHRRFTSGWTLEEIISTPVKVKSSLQDAKKETKSGAVG